MPEPTEAQIERYLRSKVAALGGMVIKIAPVIAGVPDDLVILPGGRVYFVELKTRTGTLRPIQTAMHRQLRKRGIAVHVLRGVPEVDRWLGTVEEPGYPITRRTLAQVQGAHE